MVDLASDDSAQIPYSLVRDTLQVYRLTSDRSGKMGGLEIKTNFGSKWVISSMGQIGCGRAGWSTLQFFPFYFL